MGYDGMLVGDLNDGYMHYVEECINEINANPKNNKKCSLSSFIPHDKLNERIWLPNGYINSRVRLRLLDLADVFFDSLDIDWVEVKDIILTGSLANFNWSKFSDLDVHILIDYKDVDEKTNLVSNYLSAKKNLWNEQHDNLKIYGFPVEMYVQDINEEHISSGVYSLEKNEWVIKPDKENFENIHLNKAFISKKVNEIIYKINKLSDKINKCDDEYQLEGLAKKVKALFDKIKGARKEGLKKSGEYNSFNIIFKVLRRIGALDKIYELKIKTYDKMNSLS